ncbi:MAG: hypothetical protein ABI718_00550 [Acidobacteriota bacterium]
MSPKLAFLLGAGTAVVLALIVVFAMRDTRPDSSSADAGSPSVNRSVALPFETSAGTTSGAIDPALNADQPGVISGTILLDEAAAKTVSGKVIVFVIARAGTGKGHPVFAKRLDVTSFPVAFSLGARDSMMAQPPSDHLRLEARIDRDGDAITREAGSPSATIESVPLGAHDVTLKLRL